LNYFSYIIPLSPSSVFIYFFLLLLLLPPLPFILYSCLFFLLSLLSTLSVPFVYPHSFFCIFTFPLSTLSIFSYASSLMFSFKSTYDFISFPLTYYLIFFKFAFSASAFYPSPPLFLSIVLSLFSAISPFLLVHRCYLGCRYFCWE
jgi:hypothetical protein